jgi:serine phosphatase RsbU (regulator of sigma subunit)
MRLAGTISIISIWREAAFASRWETLPGKEYPQLCWLPRFKESISNLNQNLVKRGTGNRFVTFFFGMLDEAGTCNYVNAGHNPPLLVHPDGSMKELAEGGMVLGLFADARYQSDTVRLRPNDHLVLFTDGVVEALNTSGEEFGQERLCALLREKAHATAPELLSCLREAVISFSANAPQHDDITLMILGFRESPRLFAMQSEQYKAATSLPPFAQALNEGLAR